MSQHTDLAVIKNSLDFDMQHHRLEIGRLKQFTGPVGTRAKERHRQAIAEIRAQALLLGITLSESSS